ncbi:GI16562, related [Neospora caninum Liverpool]|uniref:GI16562, related n=1 Tax=Neospora caninum (strain Liverpool) TaxID=572307 RepID=F0VPR8_NEOCL|nr:GI16562, related [Neospora caninum Liverpool]CBZ55715.1 GI16562, related [Neospora caninum Liverpool]|eukprot:XP_003885741.1 GI16562, related [Neospora caninum Liverpool]
MPVAAPAGADCDGVEEAETVRMRVSESSWTLDRDRVLVRQVELLRRLAGVEEKFTFPRPGAVSEVEESEKGEKKRRGDGKWRSGEEAGSSRDEPAASYRFSPEMEATMRAAEASIRCDAAGIKEKVESEAERKAERERFMGEVRKEQERVAREMRRQVDEMRKQMEKEKLEMVRRMEEERRRRREAMEEEERREQKKKLERQKEEEAYWKEREARRKKAEEEEERRRREREEEISKRCEERERRFREEEEELERRRQQRIREEEEERRLRDERRRREEAEDEERRQRRKQEEEREAERRRNQLKEREELARRRQKEEEEEEDRRRKQREQEEEERRRKQREQEEEEERRRRRRAEEEEEERRRKQREQEEEEERRRRRRAEEEEEERRRKQREQEEEEERRRRRRAEEEEEERRRKQREQEEEEERGRQFRQAEERARREAEPARQTLPSDALDGQSEAATNGETASTRNQEALPASSPSYADGPPAHPESGAEQPPGPLGRMAKRNASLAGAIAPSKMKEITSCSAAEDENQGAAVHFDEDDSPSTSVSTATVTGADDASTDSENESVVSASYSPRSALKHKIHDKYNSLANAFKYMDNRRTGAVTLHQFADFLDESGLDYPFSTVHDLYRQLSQPAEMLTEGLLYRNMDGDATLVQLGRRLEDIFGNMGVPFEAEQIAPTGRVTKDAFFRVSAKAGLTSQNAEALWKSIDVLGSGHLQLESVLLLLEDNVELAEVKRIEEEVAKMEGGLMSFFGRSSPPPSPQPKCKRHESCGRPLALTRKLSLGFTEAEATIDNVLEGSTTWDVLFPLTRLAMIKKMTKTVYEPEQRIQEAQDSKCPLYIVMTGSVQLLQPGLLLETVAEEKSAPQILFSEEMLEGKPNPYAVKALTKTKVFAFKREDFEKHFKHERIKRTRDVAANMALIKIVPVLNKLSEVQARRLARTFGEETFEDGEAIFKEFDEPDNFYLVKKGEAAVVKYKKDAATNEMEEVTFRIYQRGDYFGEISIIRDQTRTATVKARGLCTVLSLPKEDFNAQLRKFETSFIGRAGRVYTAQGHVDKRKKSQKKRETETKPTSIEEPDDGTDGAGVLSDALGDERRTGGSGATIEEMLATEQTKLRDECMLLLEAVPVLKDLPLERRKEIVKAMSLECFYPNTPIILQGEESQNFYVLKTGTVAAELYVGPGKPFRKIQEYNSTCYFGEMSIIKNEPRGCYITAKSPVQLYSLTGEKFRELLEDYYPAFTEYAQAQYEQETLKRQATFQLKTDDQERAQPTADYGHIMNLLVKVPVINMLDEDALQALARAFKVECYQEREVIIHEGTLAENFYIIFSGDVSVQKVVDDAPVEIVVLHAGEYLGEIAFLNEQPRTASCVAKTDVKLLSLTRSDFQVHLGALSDEFLQQAESKYGASKQEEIPDWLVEAGEQGAFYDPSASSGKAEEEDEEPGGAFCGTIDLDREKEMYNKKKERKNSGIGKKKSEATAGDTASGDEKAKAGEGAPGEHGAAGDGSRRKSGEPESTGEVAWAAGAEGAEKKNKKKKEEREEGDESTKKKGTKSQAKRRMSLAGGAALLAAAAAAQSASGEGWEEEEEDEQAERDEKKEEDEKKKDKKKKKKKKDKDDGEDATEQVPVEDRVGEIRDLVRGTLKNKYGSIAQAFQQIDGNNSENVDFDEFAEFVRDLRVQSLKKKDIQILFDDLCQPLKGTLTVGNLYRNIDKKDQLTKAEINLRWVEIFGGSRKAFKAVANLSAGEECTEENFIKVAEAAGVSEENAKSIWTELDKAQTGHMHTRIICSYMAGELTAEEAAAKEEEHASFGTRLWNFFGGSGSDDENEKSANNLTTQGDEEKIKEALKWEDMAIVQRDDHRAYPTCTKRLVEVLVKKEGFMYLQLLQLRYVASTMRRECLTKGVRVMEAGDEACMVFCAWGEFKIVQAGLFGESEIGVVGPDECFGLSELVNDTPLTASLVTEVDNSVLWVLERDTYHDLIRDMLEARRAVVPVIEHFLKSVPIIKDMSDTEILHVAAACKIETFSPHQTVFRAGMAGDMFCFIFKGEITMLKPMGAGQEPIELGRLQAGVYFGEMAVIKNQRRTASIIAATDLTLFCLDKGSFERVLGRVKGKMIERAESLYKRQDVATTDPKEGEDSASASPAAAAAAGGGFSPGDQFEKKRTRKSSLALLQYAKIREVGNSEGEGEKKGGGDEEEESEARWAMAQDPEIIHRPPPLSAAPKKSALRTTSGKSVGMKKNSVFFDEETLLPSPPSSDEDA